MLLGFECSNHKAIKDEVNISLLAGSEKIFTERLIEFSKRKFLPCAVVFGANGSGKSSLLDAVSFMKDTVVKGASAGAEWSLRQTPHKASSPDSRSTYCVQIVEDGVRYAYGFAVSLGMVSDEYLFAFPKGRKVVVFDREGLNLKIGDKFKKSLGACAKSVEEDRPFLSTAVKYGRAKETDDVYRFFFEDLFVLKFGESLRRDRLFEMLADGELKQSALGLLQSFGTGMKDIETCRKEDGSVSVRIAYDGVKVDFEDESDGLKRLVSLCFLIADAQRGEKVLLVDDLEEGLHESVTEQIVRMNQRKMCGSSQLIFTGYSSWILNESFRKDQIYFTRLKEDRSVDLYSLIQLSNVYTQTGFGSCYLRGTYGAVPEIENKLKFDCSAYDFWNHRYSESDEDDYDYDYEY